MFNETFAILKYQVYFSHVFVVIIRMDELWNTVIICGTPELHSLFLSQYTCCTDFVTFILQSKSQHPSQAGDIILEKQETSKMAVQATTFHLSPHDRPPG